MIFNILQVFGVAIWLTVHRPLDIPKLLGAPMGVGPASIDVLDRR